MSIFRAVQEDPPSLKCSKKRVLWGFPEDGGSKLLKIRQMFTTEHGAM
jgi:hypothetical protein